MSEEIIKKINKIAIDFFKNNSEKEWIPAKALMPDLIKSGIFTKDIKKGLPLRKILRQLDREGGLENISLIHAERNESTVYWYFVREGATFSPKEPKQEVTKKQKAINKREQSDEYYLIGLINELLGNKASHQHKFDFLLGDYHKNGKTRTELPLDAFYIEQNLAIEFIENDETVSETESKMTISGVSRAEQREIYRQRKISVLKGNDINLVEIEYALFEQDSEQKLVRKQTEDIDILKKKLKLFLKK